MKKFGKVMLIAGVLSAAAAIPALAAGWSNENGTWYYYNNDGSYAIDSWKSSGNSYFYLGDDGSMVTDSLIDDGNNYYYVNSYGVMVKNQWVAIPSDDDSEAEYRWYYFGSDGKAYKDSSSPVTINGKQYMFDDEGKMLYGFVDENGDMITDDSDAPLEALRYFGSWQDGSMYTGWLRYTEDLDDTAYEDYDQLWFYFSTANGKKYSDSTKTINGYKYSFDENGVMDYGWSINTATSSSASDSLVTTTKYFSEADNGSLKKNTWIYAIPGEDINEDDYDDGTYRWFYANASGTVVTDDTKKINGKWYIFDEDGIMQSGLLVLKESTVGASGQGVSEELDTDEVSAQDIYDLGDANSGDLNLFYFGADDSDGAMKKSTTVKLELSDDTYTFGFDSTGKAYNQIKNKKYYKYGILQTADSDSNYGVVEYGDSGEYVLVNAAGTVITSGMVKDSDGNYYAIYDGTIAFIGEDDLASKAASAYKSGKTTFTYDDETYTVSDFIDALYTRHTATT